MMLEYYILWWKSRICSVDAYLLRLQEQDAFADDAESQQREYERQMAVIRLNRTYGELK